MKHVTFIVSAALALIVLTAGCTLYPPSSHPYQGPIMIGTNDAPAPHW